MRLYTANTWDNLRNDSVENSGCQRPSLLRILTNNGEADDGGELGVGVDLALVPPGVQLADVPDLQLPGVTAGRDRHLQPRVGAEDEAADSEDRHVGQPQPGDQVVAGQPSQGALEEGGAGLHHRHRVSRGQELRQVGLLQAGGRPEHGEVGGGLGGHRHHLPHPQHLQAEQEKQPGGHHQLTSIITMNDGESTLPCDGLSLIIIVTSQCP